MPVYSRNQHIQWYTGRHLYDSAGSGVQFYCLDNDETGTQIRLQPGLVVFAGTRIVTPFNAGSTNTIRFGKPGVTADLSAFGTTSEIVATVAGWYVSTNYYTGTLGRIASIGDAISIYDFSGTAPTQGEARFLLGLALLI